jgi:polyvinyl alcohol dehydrogenase (cytochrome)
MDGRGDGRVGRSPIARPRLPAIVIAGLACALMLGLAGCAAPTPAVPSHAATAPPVAEGPAWPGYHDDNARRGAAPGTTTLDRLATAWTTRLPGALHNEPVAADGRIIVADESNHVSALDPRTGRVIWRRDLGTPLTRVQELAGCGNIDPLGITSTPVIDTATGTVYVVGEVDDGGSDVHHQLEGISIATGRVVLSEDVDPPLPDGESAIHLLQRASLALANGRIYVSYGGNSGDCGSYHGWIVGVHEAGAPHTVAFEVASDGEGGAIWQAGGAPAIDSAGDLYVSTGNANPDPPQGGPDPKNYTESVVKLSPTLRPLASFKDQVAGGDEDLSTGNPVLLPGGKVFTVGKTDIAYLLRQSDLTLVARVTGVCGSDPDGGPAYDAHADRVFVPCKGGGIQIVDLGTTGSAPKLGARLAGANSAPIVVGDHVWALQYPSGDLTEFDAQSGEPEQRISVGDTVSNFATPSVAYDRLLVGTSSGVTAFVGSR